MLRRRDPSLPLEQALSDTEAKFEVLTDAMPQMVWSTRSDGFHDYFNARWYEFTGAAPGSTDGEGWNGKVHPDDRERARALWQHCLATGEPYDLEYRLMHHSGEYRWTLGRALPVRRADGAIVRWIGTCTDIHEAKRSAELNTLLSHELSHRIKNIFAVVSGLISLSSRHFPEARAFATQLRQRIEALGRAHEFVRPHSEASRPVLGATTVHGILAELFSPYPAWNEGRLTVSGDDCEVDDRGATPLALLFHELATNASKYGALSNDRGRIAIEIAFVAGAGTLRLVWSESGGPPISGTPQITGFGSKLAEISVVQQLGGRLQRNWSADGLVVEIELEPSRLSRRSD